MGQLASYLWPDTGRIDDPDPVTKLTSRDRYLLSVTWANLTETQAKTVETGVLIFMTLFKKRPHYKDLFPFRDIPMEELPENIRFRAHCVTVVYALTSMVSNIDVPDLLEELLLKQGAAHVARRVPEGAYEAPSFLASPIKKFTFPTEEGRLLGATMNMALISHISDFLEPKLRSAMGTAVSYFFPNTGRTNDPDPVTGLTSREKYLVRTSWARVMKTPTENGVALLLLFFKTYPDYQNLFPFKDVPYDDLKDNARFKAHCSSVIHALDSIIASINDNDVLIQLLKKTGSTHVKRGVTQRHFEHLKEVTVELFSQIMKPVEIEAWKKTLQVAWSQIYEGLKEE